MIIIWASAMVILLIVEAATFGLTCIWFAIGALAALISAWFGAPEWLQILWFAVISLATLYLTRPLASKYVNAKRQPTNADRCIGMSGLVRERIDNLEGTGAVYVDGKLWTARSVTGEIIGLGAVVLVSDIEGVKLMVRPVAGIDDEPEPVAE